MHRNSLDVAKWISYVLMISFFVSIMMDIVTNLILAFLFIQLTSYPIWFSFSIEFLENCLRTAVFKLLDICVTKFNEVYRNVCLCAAYRLLFAL